MSKHIRLVFLYFSISALSAVIVFISPEVSQAPGAGQTGRFNVATHSVRAVESSGNTYVTEWTESTDFPTWNAAQSCKILDRRRFLLFTTGGLVDRALPTHHHTIRTTLIFQYRCGQVRNS